MTKESKFKEIVQPFIVLVGICLVVAFLLGYLNSITEPVIAENTRIAAEQTRKEVLTKATSFTEVECDTEALGIDSAYVDDGGAGYVITAARKGYGGNVTVTVGIDPEGKVIGIAANVSTETTGIGSRAGEKDYTGQYLGISGTADDIDTISGATYSSKAVRAAVSAALAAYDSIKEAA